MAVDLETMKINISMGEKQYFTLDYRQKISLKGKIRGDEHDNPFKSADYSTFLIQHMDTGHKIYEFRTKEDPMQKIDEQIIADKGKYVVLMAKDGGKGNGNVTITYKVPINVPGEDEEEGTDTRNENDDYEEETKKEDQEDSTPAYNDNEVMNNSSTDDTSQIKLNKKNIGIAIIVILLIIFLVRRRG